MKTDTQGASAELKEAATMINMMGVGVMMGASIGALESWGLLAGIGIALLMQGAACVMLIKSRDSERDQALRRAGGRE